MSTPTIEIPRPIVLEAIRVRPRSSTQVENSRAETDGGGLQQFVIFLFEVGDSATVPVLPVPFALFSQNLVGFRYIQGLVDSLNSRLCSLSQRFRRKESLAPMAYKTSLIIGPDGSTQSHIHDLMGCFSLASTKERATMKLKSAIPEYFHWLRSHGEDAPVPPMPRFTVVQELRIRGNPSDAGGPDPLLHCDKVVASPRSIARCLRLLRYTREDLLKLVSGIPRKELGRRPEGEPRSVRNALRHIAQVDIWYLSRIGADPRLDKAKMKNIFTFLDYSRSLVSKALPSLTETQLVKVFYPRKWSDRPYPWTTSKVLHRLVTRE